MYLNDKAKRLFEYISQIYPIDLPANRNINKYRAEISWQSDIIKSSQCKIKEFDSTKLELLRLDAA